MMTLANYNWSLAARAALPRWSLPWVASLALALALVGCGDDPAKLACPSGKACGFTAIAAGAAHTCAIYGVVEDEAGGFGQVACWGYNRDGQCGEPSGAGSVYAVQPVVVPDLNDAVKISAGGTQSCALRASGQLVCWGSNRFGELGDLGDEGSFVPVGPRFPVTAADREQVVTGGSINGGTNCMRDVDSQLWCWGRNQAKQIRNSDEATQNAPLLVLEDTDDVAVGQDFVCVISNQRVLCQGAGYGPGLVDMQISNPVPTTLSAQGFRACLLREDDVTQQTEAVCFTKGQIVSVQGSNRLVADSVVTPIADAVSMAVGAEHACVLRDDDSVVCWGNPASGRLGLGIDGVDPQDPTNELALVPVALRDTSGDPRGVNQIASGAGHSCAVDNDHRVLCWGDNASGQLGDGTRSNRSAPTLIQPPPQ